MPFSRRPAATLRIPIIFVALLSFLLAPTQAASACAPCSAPETAVACGGCCEVMACCVQTPEPPAQPAIPAALQHSNLDFSVVLMAATRPLLGLLPAGERDLIATTHAPLGRSRDSFAMLCVRLL